MSICPHVLRRSLGIVIALVLSVGGLVRPSGAQVGDVRVGEPVAHFHTDGTDWKDCGLRKVDVNAFTSVRPEQVSKRSKTATIDVTYSGFTPEAKAAFERAVDVWERHIQSDIPIRINASFEDLEPGVLGGTTPLFAYAVDTDEDGTFNIAVIDALADAISGENQQSGEPDFEMVLNKSRDDWHYGQDDAPAGMIDFTSVVVHEIAHGLGYLDFANVSDGEGQYGIDFDDDGTATPSVYTFFLAKEEGEDTRRSLVDESEFPNGSTELGDAMRSDQLVFNGINAITTADSETGPIPPKVYAPGTFQNGSSLSHLDENTYDPESENALMTPRLNAAETVRMPGPIVCGQLKDMLWPLGDGCKQYLADVFALQFAESPDPEDGSVTLSWQVRQDADPQEYIVEQKYFDGAFRPVKTVQSPPVTLDSLGLGKFEFRLRWVRSDGSEGTTPQTVKTTFRARDVAGEIAERDPQGRARVNVSWAVPPGTQNFAYQVERKTGTTGAFEEVATVTETNYTAERQTPGTYAYRVTATDESGNRVVGADEDQVDVSFDGAVYVLGPYPNPARSQATFDLTARSAQSVDIAVYNVAGQRLYSEQRDVGAQAPELLTFDTSRWSSGMYFLRVRGTDFTKTRKLVVTR